MKHKLQLLPGTLLLILGSAPLVGQVDIPNVFEAGQPARAADVNANFQALKAAVEQLQTAHAESLNRIALLETELDGVLENNALALHDHMSVIPDPVTAGAYTVQFSGVNVQIVNGVGQDTANGTGNLIVGYNNPRVAGWASCSNGSFASQTICQSNGHVWGLDFKSGSHNLVLGDRNSYGQTGGLVSGYNNAINRSYATVTGGEQNLAEGFASSVSGGSGNQALASHSHISGGYQNGTQGPYSSISGGRNSGTTPASTYSSILGGNGSIANSQDQTVP